MTTPPSARTSPGISILYLRSACAAITSSDPPSRNAPHTVVRVIPRASYDWGGDTRTHAPAPIPATQPSTIATLYTLSEGTGYGEESMSAHHREQPGGEPGSRPDLAVLRKSGEALQVLRGLLCRVAVAAINGEGVAARVHARLPGLESLRTGLGAGAGNLARDQRVGHLAGHRRHLGVAAVVAEIPRRAEEREVGHIDKLHEEFLSSREPHATRRCRGGLSDSDRCAGLCGVHERGNVRAIVAGAFRARPVIVRIHGQDAAPVENI